MKRSSIGIGIITCNRLEFFRNCIRSIPDADNIIVVNDGAPYLSPEYPSKVKNIIQNMENLGVGRSKNIALKYLLDQKCEHIFLCEDDIQIVEQNVYDHYIRASLITGIQHFNYAYHGPGNRTADGRPSPRKIIDYKNISISLNRNILGAFSYYSRICLEKSGLMDEKFKNAWEHVDHTYKIIKLKMHPAYWWFADVARSFEFIADQHKNHSLSVIRKSPVWKLRLRYNSLLFKIKNGYLPTSIPDTEESLVLAQLDEIKNNFSSLEY